MSTSVDGGGGVLLPGDGEVVIPLRGSSTRSITGQYIHPIGAVEVGGPFLIHTR